MYNEVGRPTELTEEVTLKIRQGVLEDQLFKDIQQELQISPNTWDTWIYKDYKGLRTNINNWRKERMIKKAEKVVERSMESDTEKVALDAAQFTLETLGKLDYSKRTELTGKDGKDIPVPIINVNRTVGTLNINALSRDNSIQEDKQPQAEN
jgi:hypothetical protein